ncbi:polyketide synthase, putative [Talaromyces stipitatus ATCC 10500]|uniref:Polyketide synthase, putative n=1 Tax=Talaromyces stipitatus (strain ATCC 10500 / CBS 375.48 / QM 6759 / NRRL 1006) TaxID=441959 RepID=B8MGX9_TALSN|nr:polyketide synthase, putative [Talaromyces stipitatus ATCC 10500]EED16360.1 polyketide synthase, putative [Talaromyces stipitatus ATCC 10500]
MLRERSIIFFGDLSLSIHPAFSQLLRSQKEHSLLSNFLNQAKSALQAEATNLSVIERKELPSLTDLYSLSESENGNASDHPILSPALLVILQLGQFISWYEEHPERRYPESDSTLIAGICVGQISATAISLAKSLTELLPLAVDAVRIAFRLGTLTTTARNDLEASLHEAWAVVIPRDITIPTEDVLDGIVKESEILGRKKPYITAYFPKTVTIQGPPSTLRLVSDWLQKTRGSSPSYFASEIPIYAPYHAPHLYNQDSVLQILKGLEFVEKTNDTWSFDQTKVISPTTGTFYDVSDRLDIMKKALHDILLKPIDWEKLCEGCTSFVTSSEPARWTIRPFGPSKAAKNLLYVIHSEANADIILDETFVSSSTDQVSTTTKVPIAIIGMSGRFPDSKNPGELWKLLEQGIDCHKVIPADRFDASLYVSQDRNSRNKSKSPYGCFIENPGMFDPRFFNMSPKEAAQTDPQQRLALVTAYEALEMAGYVPNSTPSTQLDRIGTFYGQTTDDYKDLNTSQDIDTYYVSSVIRAFGPGRVSRSNQLGGPSVSVDTACSSSAMALNLACTSIWCQECDTAVVGGMLLLGSPEMYAGLSKGHFISETGPCKTFDDAADGYCRGESVASIVIKRLDAAKADNDNILAVILGAGTNYSAYAASITQPHGPTQEMLYRKVLNQAGLHPFDIDYVEMHGTGTQLGDAVEMSSVSNVFAPALSKRPADKALLVGSVKPNIGHGESASGITSLIKALLILREQKVPPHIGIRSGVLNHTFTDLAKRNVHIPLKATAFPRNNSRKRRLMVNNFGAAGGNSAFILEEGPAYEGRGVVDSRVDHVISVTAKTASSLQKNISNLISYLEQNPEVSLSDLSYTTTARRVQHPLRATVIASNIDELKGHLIQLLETKISQPDSGKLPGVAFAFTGQGSVYLSLGQQLFQSNSQFRADLTRFDQICQGYEFKPFLPVINRSAADINNLSPTQTQLALVSVQIALARLWASWGITPNLVIGHSLGEYAALNVSGVLSISDTLYLVGIRASFLENLCTKNTHSMLAVHATVEDVKSAAGNKLDRLELACVNGPEDIVLSGLVEDIQELNQHLKLQGFKCTVLKVPFAFHSSQTDPILDSLEKAAQSVRFLKPEIPVVSTLLGTVVKETSVFGPSYLRRHAREPVNFDGALRKSYLDGLVDNQTVWLEVGPEPICLAMVKSILGSEIKAFPTLRKSESPWRTSAKTLSALHSLGFDVTWKEYHRDFEDSQRLLHLPSYAFDEKNYWIDYKNDWLLHKGTEVVEKKEPPRINSGPATTTVQTLITEQVKDDKVFIVFESDLSEPKLHALIAGHSLNGLALCPSGVFADMALTVGDYIRRKHQTKLPASSGSNIVDMQIVKPVTVTVPRVKTPELLRISGTADLQKGIVEVTFGSYSAQSGKADQNAKCIIEFGDTKLWLNHWSRSAYLIQKRIEDLERGVKTGDVDKLFEKTIYRLFSAVVDYDPRYHGMKEVMINSSELEAVALVRLYEGTDAGNFFCSPLWLDNLAQLAGFIMNGVNVVDPRKFVYISHGWGSYQLADDIDAAKPYHVHVKMHPAEKNVVAGEVSIFQGGTIIGLCSSIKFQKVPRSLMEMLLAPPSHQQQSNTQVPSQRTTSLSSKQPRVAPERKAVIPEYYSTKSQPGIKSMALETIAQEIGITAVELVDDATFVELGVDSLMALTILSKLRESLHLDLPSDIFQELTTIGDLRGFLDKFDNANDDEVDTPSSDSMSPILPTPDDETTIAGDILNTVYSIMAQQIGVEIEELLAVDDLSSLGLDSLMSLSIQGAIQEALSLKVELQLDGTAKLPTLVNIQEALGLSPTVPLSVPQPRIPATSHRASLGPSASTLLLQGNLRSGSRFLFMFPDGSGSPAAYAALPEISPDLVVYGLNSPFLQSADKYDCSIEEIAHIMLQAVQSIQPHGPYTLAGWSAGGMYAFEAARQLTQAGETVSKLILIDSPCRSTYEPMPINLLNFLVSSTIFKASNRIVDHFRSTIRALQNYSPTEIDASRAFEVFIIWAEKGLSEDLKDAERGNVDWSHGVANWLFKREANAGPLGWEKLLPGRPISVTDVAGNHFSMVNALNSKSLGRSVADAMRDDLRDSKQQWRIF